MKLPNGDKAIVDEAKLIDYCLSTTHPRGRHKARLFAAVLGITRHQAILLRSALYEAARDGEVTPAKRNDFGDLYELEFNCVGPGGLAPVLSVWVVLDADSEKLPRLVTCYPV